MKLVTSYLVIFFFGYAALACSSANRVHVSDDFPVGEYDYTGFDRQGQKLVEGRVSITLVRKRRIGSEESLELKGNWELRKVGTEDRIGAQVGKGELIGSLEKKEIYINLNPNVSDGNVILRGQLVERGFNGSWRVHTLSGVINEGRFEAKLK